MEVAPEETLGRRRLGHYYSERLDGPHVRRPGACDHRGSNGAASTTTALVRQPFTIPSLRPRAS
jgi:hypothetical protein